MVFQSGYGGKGMDKRTTGVRIMDANQNQGKRVNYMNKDGQTVDPSTGRLNLFKIICNCISMAE